MSQQSIRLLVVQIFIKLAAIGIRILLGRLSDLGFVSGWGCSNSNGGCHVQKPSEILMLDYVTFIVYIFGLLNPKFVREASLPGIIAMFHGFWIEAVLNFVTISLVFLCYTFESMPNEQPYLNYVGVTPIDHDPAMSSVRKHMRNIETALEKFPMNFEKPPGSLRKIKE